jgi:DNA-binding NarL/FixJ family response regulator
VRVLLADDHALFRAGIASLMDAWGAEVVGEASNGFEALELTRLHRPDLVLMDISMPECNGLESTRLIKAEHPDTHIVIATVSDDDTDLFEAIKSGAEGYLLKDMSADDLERTLDAVSTGQPALSPALAARIVEEFTRQTRDESTAEPESTLTARESEVLTLVAEGGTNQEIADALELSPHTVSFHMKNILQKLHLRNRAQAAAYAIRKGLVQPPE